MRKIVWIIVGAVMGIVALAAFGVFVLFKSSSEEPMAFVQDVASGNYNAAYEYFSPELKMAQTYDAFTAGMRSLKMDSSCELEVETAGASVSTSGGSLKTVSGAVVCDTKRYSAKFEMMNTSEGYKIYSYDVKVE